MDTEANNQAPTEDTSAPVTPPVAIIQQDGPVDSGFNDGDKLSDGTIVRHDHDENGKYTGWHKEAPASNTEVQI